MQLISKFNKVFRFLLCVIDINNKYERVVPLKNKKDITITNAFLKILDNSGCKSNKVWVNRGSEFYNRSMKLSSEDNGLKMYPTYNEGKPVLLLKDLLEP